MLPVNSSVSPPTPSYSSFSLAHSLEPRLEPRPAVQKPTVARYGLGSLGVVRQKCSPLASDGPPFQAAERIAELEKAVAEAVAENARLSDQLESAQAGLLAIIGAQQRLPILLTLTLTPPPPQTVSRREIDRMQRHIDLLSERSDSSGIVGRVAHLEQQNRAMREYINSLLVQLVAVAERD